MEKRKRLRIYLALAVFAFIVMCVGNRLLFYRSTPLLDTARANVSPLQEGIGTSVTFATNPSEVAQSVNSVASFVSSRSSVTISASISNRLQDLETRTLNGQLRRLTPSQVAGALSDSLHERLASVTDAQIDSMANNSFRVCTDARNVSYWSPQVVLRKTGQGVKDAPTFIQKAKEYRDSSTPEALLYRSLAPGIIAEHLQKRFSELQAEVSGWSGNDLSPVQSYTLGYSLITDDDLVFSLSRQLNVMQRIEDRLFTAHGVPRSAAGRRPFGENGYLYSSPSDIFFGDQTVIKFLNRLEALGQL
ncbi:MAG TPA: hypothetical protein VKA70_07240 [Blastocatellia bacterium]|nr:hypothetical protein [Blastocatellia bacterium]